MEALVIILIIIIWLSLATIASIIGNSKGEDAGVWFFYGLFLPPIAIAHAIVRHRTLKEERKRNTLVGRIACHLCDEYISPKAVVCPFCQRNIEHNEINAEQPASANRVGDKAQSSPTTDNDETSEVHKRIMFFVVIVCIVGIIFAIGSIIWTASN